MRILLGIISMHVLLRKDCYASCINVFRQNDELCILDSQTHFPFHLYYEQWYEIFYISCTYQLHLLASWELICTQKLKTLVQKFQFAVQLSYIEQLQIVQLPSVRKFSYVQNLVEFGIISSLRVSIFMFLNERKRKVSNTTNVKIALLFP